MHNIVINYNGDYKDYKSLDLDKLAAYALDKHCEHGSTCCSINFINSDNIRDLNKKYRNIDNPTDVLSFECDSVNDDFEKNDTFELGDIFICPEIALNNCKKFNTNIHSELKLLTVHGILHLCGYDHIELDQANEMEDLEEQILDGWNNKQDF